MFGRIDILDFDSKEILFTIDTPKTCEVQADIDADPEKQNSIVITRSIEDLSNSGLETSEVLKVYSNILNLIKEGKKIQLKYYISNVPLFDTERIERVIYGVTERNPISEANNQPVYSETLFIHIK